MIEVPQEDPSALHPDPAQSETTQMSVIHMVVLAIIVLLLIISIVAVTLLPLASLRRTPAQPSGDPQPTNAPSVQPTIAPPPIPTPTPTPVPAKLPSVTASATPYVIATPIPTAEPSVQTKILTKPAGQIGSVTDAGYVNSLGNIDVGRNGENVYRGFVAFDLADIPSSATIRRATLRIYQRAVYGTPYSALGSLEVDHLDYGSTLTTDAYSGGTIFGKAIGTIGSSIQGEWKSLDVTSQVRQDRTTHSSSQFRLHFANEIKGGSAPGDIASFSRYGDGSEDPQLVVEYF